MPFLPHRFVNPDGLVGLVTSEVAGIDPRFRPVFMSEILEERKSNVPNISDDESPNGGRLISTLRKFRENLENGKTIANAPDVTPDPGTFIDRS